MMENEGINKSKALTPFSGFTVSVHLRSAHDGISVKYNAAPKYALDPYFTLRLGESGGIAVFMSSDQIGEMIAQAAFALKDAGCMPESASPTIKEDQQFDGVSISIHLNTAREEVKVSYRAADEHNARDSYFLLTFGENADVDVYMNAEQIGVLIVKASEALEEAGILKVVS